MTIDHARNEKGIGNGIITQPRRTYFMVCRETMRQGCRVSDIPMTEKLPSLAEAEERLPACQTIEPDAYVLEINQYR